MNENENKGLHGYAIRFTILDENGYSRIKWASINENEYAEKWLTLNDSFGMATIFETLDKAIYASRCEIDGYIHNNATAIEIFKIESVYIVK